MIDRRLATDTTLHTADKLTQEHASPKLSLVRPATFTEHCSTLRIATSSIVDTLDTAYSPYQGNEADKRRVLQPQMHIHALSSSSHIHRVERIRCIRVERTLHSLLRRSSTRNTRSLPLCKQPQTLISRCRLFHASYTTSSKQTTRGAQSILDHETNIIIMVGCP